MRQQILISSIAQHLLVLITLVTLCAAFSSLPPIRSLPTHVVARQLPTSSSSALYSRHSDQSNDDGTSLGGGRSKFVPAFVAVWAVGYSALALLETSGDGLGDSGGFIGVGLVTVLMFALISVAAYEVFKE